MKISVKKNISDISSLKLQVADLEQRNQTLETQLTKIDLMSRKNNLLLHGLAETNLNENTKVLVRHFFENALKLHNAEEITLVAVFRIGKPPHPTTWLKCMSP